MSLQAVDLHGCFLTVNSPEWTITMIIRPPFRHSELPAALLSLPGRFRPHGKMAKVKWGGRAVAAECDYVSKVVGCGRKGIEVK